MQLDVGGHAIYAANGGKPFDPALPCVVFVHGAGFDHTAWKLLTRYFAWHGYGVLAPDLPGHCRSEGPLVPTIQGMADWLVALLDAAGVEKAALVGHSMGSIVTLDAAARHGDRVSALALLGCAVPMRVHDDLLSSARANDHLAMDLSNSWGYGRAAQRGVHRVPGLWMMRGGLRTLEQSGDGVLFNDMNACNDYDDGETAAGQVACPTLFILGEKDMMTPLKAARSLAEKIDGARTVVIPGAGHIMIEETPDDTLDALREFL
ncbi:MAG: alpha/beta hydrolase [Alphaproteobacteria bacterium]|jgi:pimeloyl-ACP methyl ester carboxylesterase|nr:alpha/beta hydrolase [Alphaproteobacteria bacterium]MDP6565454.1 alpha/beta hydrolase [Alphaproteobacteria bacterium]MDP6815688.1 alpha/beta hydrolase [Alphaproteobacteria bacterium]